MKDYRETKQITVCGVPKGKRYVACAGYEPRSETSVYCAHYADDGGYLCTRPEGGPGKEGPESEIDGCIAEVRAMSKALGRVRRIREMPEMEDLDEAIGYLHHCLIEEKRKALGGGQAQE